MSTTVGATTFPRTGNGSLSENALRVMRKRYLHPGEETWEHVCRRVAKHLTKDDHGYEDMFFNAIFDQEFIPNSPTLRNAGLSGAQLSACFVLGPEGTAKAIDKPVDSLATMNALKTHASEITKSGGGVGVHYGAFRPKGMKVRGGAHGKALGPVSFMASLNDWTKRLTQAGFREAAMMSMLPVWHPDVVEFILCKQSEGAIHNTNISVAVDDAFIEAVRHGFPYKLHFPGWIPTIEHFPEHFREHIKVSGTQCSVDAAALMDLICLNAWRNGEPGLFFIERENRTNPWHLVNLSVCATNPCGEVPLPDFGACNLGHVVLGRCVELGEKPSVDWDKLRRLVDLGVRFLDNVISTNSYPLPEITAMAEKYRNIGLGVIGWADMLLELEIPYGSPESLALADQIIKYIYKEAHITSARIFEEKGGDQEVFKAVSRRNLVLLTVAPTGTTGQLVDQHGGGIEPIYAPNTWRYDHVHPEGYQMVVPGAERNWFRSAINDDPKKQVTVEQHILMQAAFQAHVDASISKTINMPNGATVEDVRKAYLLAFDSGCKGITIYRDGSRQMEVLTTKKKEGTFDPTLKSGGNGTAPSNGNGTHAPAEEQKVPYELPEIMECRRLAFRDGNNNRVLLNLGFDPKTSLPAEISLLHSKTEPELDSLSKALGIVTSIALQEGIPAERLGNALRGIRAGWGGWAKLALGDKRRSMITSVPDAIAAMLLRHSKTGGGEDKNVEHPQEEPKELEIPGAAICKKCNARARVKEGGCEVCKNCADSKCG